MRQNVNAKKYFLYARKSTQSEDRQVQSIEDQKERLQELATKLDIKIVRIFTEAKSASKPDNRPIFSDMMERLEKGEAEGILCWKINRLSRNPIDSGNISWMLQQKTIKSILTISREFRPEDNVLIFNVETGSANQYSKDLSEDTKRGLHKKAKRGHRPGPTPIGYLNDKINKTNVKDPERFNLVRKMWDMMLSGAYTPRQITDIANDKWGLRTVKKKNSGGKLVSASTIYQMFANPFYAGIVELKDKNYGMGKHEPMVSLDEFDKVQVLLGRRGRRRPKKHNFAFTGMIKCGECGCSVTAEEKKKIIKSTGKVKKYVYYHCTNRKQGYDCSQKKYIRLEDLETQIELELDRIRILPEFKDWALEMFEKDSDRQAKTHNEVYEMRHKDVVATEKELQNLVRMRYREQVDDEFYNEESRKLKKKLEKQRQRLKDSEKSSEDWLKAAEEKFEFACHAPNNFEEGDNETKRDILAKLGSNPVLKDKKLEISICKYFEPIIEKYPKLEKEYQALELDKKPLNKAKKEALTSIRARWLRGSDSN